MIKIFCDECGKELTENEIRHSEEMIGTKHLCSSCSCTYLHKMEYKNGWTNDSRKNRT